MSIKKMVIALGIALATVSSGAYAASIIGAYLLPAGLNEFEDSDVERVLRDGQVITAGNIQVGDVFEAALLFTNVNNQLIAGLEAPPYQLTAYSRLRVAELLDPNNNALACAGAICDIRLAPDITGGVSIQIYENPAGAFSLAAPAATTIAQSQSGNLLVEIGEAKANDFWVVDNSIISLTVLAGLTQGDPQAPNGNFGLSLISNPGGLPILPLGVTANNFVDGVFGAAYDFRGNTSVYGRGVGVNTQWLASTNSTVQFATAIPEPGPLALLGIGIAALGFARRRVAEREQ